MKEASGIPAFDLIAHLHRQRAFSERTFGPGARTATVFEDLATLFQAADATA